MTEALYPHLPISLQNVACSWYGRKEAKIRLGRDFENHLTRLLESEKWSRTEVQAYQDERVRELIRYAYDHVPFHRDRIRERKLTPVDIRTVDDLAKLPVLTKEEVRNNRDRLLSTEARSTDLQLRHTSGTTGKALELYVNCSAIAMPRRSGVIARRLKQRAFRSRVRSSDDTVRRKFEHGLTAPPQNSKSWMLIRF